MSKSAFCRCLKNTAARVDHEQSLLLGDVEYYVILVSINRDLQQNTSATATIEDVAKEKNKFQNNNSARAF